MANELRHKEKTMLPHISGREQSCSGSFSEDALYDNQLSCDAHNEAKIKAYSINC